MMQYNQLWFETVWGTCEDDVTMELWKKEFRMSVETFKYLLDLIGVNLRRLGTRFRKAIKVEKRTAIVIWTLSTGNSYKSVSRVFGVGKSTVIKIFQDGINHIVQLAPTFVKFPFTTLRSNRQRCSIKKVFLEFSQNSQENTCARVSFLMHCVRCQNVTCKHIIPEM